MTDIHTELLAKASKAVPYLVSKGLSEYQARDLINDMQNLIAADQGSDFPRLCPESLDTLNTVIDYAVARLA